MENKAEVIAFFAIFLSVILFVILPISETWWTILLFCFGFSLLVVKGIWITAGWASDKVKN